MTTVDKWGTEPQFVSKCHRARVTWGVDTDNTYTLSNSYGAVWICSVCHKPCEVVEGSYEEE